MDNLKTLLLLLPFIFLRCSNDKIEKAGYVIGVVDSTKRVHWGKGFYKLNVYFSFNISNHKVNGLHEHKLEQSYTSKFIIGDSVLIKYDRSDFEKNQIVKITYAKRK